MHSRTSSRSRILRKLGWLTPAILIAATAILTTWQVRTDEKIPAQKVPTQHLRVISRALDFISKNYVDREKVDHSKMLDATTKELARSIPPFLVQKESKGLKIRMGDKTLQLPFSDSISRSELSLMISRILGFLNMFYDGRLDEQDRLTVAMSGITQTLDPHTNYLSPKVYQEFKIGTKGNFGGLGIVIGIRDGVLSVIAPLEGTPAYKAGIKAKDKIIQIEEESTINMSLTEAVEKLRGRVGTKVSIVIRREGVVSPLDFTITRALIHIQSVAGKLLDDKRYGLIKVKNFQEDTMEEVQKILHSFHKQSHSFKGLILDLRNDPGGLLDQAVALSDFFLENGVIVKTVGAHGEAFDIEKATSGDLGEDLPLVVIVNEGSASASEIVSGALQFNDRAVIIGNRTFGKGSVQTVYDLKDGSALKITIAKYLTAHDQPVQSIGINPDIGLIPAKIPASYEEMIPQGDKSEKPAKRLDLFEDVKRRELDLLESQEEEEESKEPNLPSPRYQITYLSSEREDEEETGQIHLDGDFPVVLGERLLSLSEKLSKYLPPAESRKRQRLLDAFPPLLDELKVQEEKRIEESIGKLQVNWTSQKAEGKPTAKVSLEVLNENKQPQKVLRTGDRGFVKVTVSNRSKAPFYRLAAVTQSEDPIFANLEFPFGRVEPGQTGVWLAPVKIPEFVHRRSIPVSLEWHEANQRLPHSPEFSIQIEEPPVPLFAYTYEIIDNGQEGTKGNGNHRVDPGEIIGLRLTIHNQGKGESSKPVVDLRKDEGDDIFIEKGRAELTPLAPGGQVGTLLRFRVPAKRLDKLSFDLNIRDQKLGEDLSDHLDMNQLPPQKSVLAPPRIDLPWDKLPLMVKGKSYTVKGTATDDQQLKNVVIFVGKEKIFYKSPENTSKSFSFEASLPLKKGPNLITLAAQDNRDLTARKQWLVWRAK